MPSVIVLLIPYFAIFISIAWPKGKLLSAIIYITISCSLAVLWLDYLNDQHQGNGIAEALGAFLAYTSVVGLLSGAMTDFVLRITGWRIGSTAGMTCLFAGLCLPPVIYIGIITLDRWQNRPPGPECSNNLSLNASIGDSKMNFPNIPIVNVYTENNDYYLKIPSHRRESCRIFDARNGWSKVRALILHFHELPSKLSSTRKSALTPADCAMFGVAPRDCPTLADAWPLLDRMTVFSEEDRLRLRYGIGSNTPIATLQKLQSSGMIPGPGEDRNGLDIGYLGRIWTRENQSVVIICSESPRDYQNCTAEMPISPHITANFGFYSYSKDVLGTYATVSRAVKLLVSSWSQRPS